MMSLNTADIIILAIGALLGVGQALTIKYLAWLGTASIEMSRDIASMKTTLATLPLETMKTDITSNRHKISTLDRGLAKVEERLGAMERRCDIIHQTPPSHERQA